MTAAAVLTAFAILGVAVGIVLGTSRIFSIYLAAAGGGLLFGISLFWLLPEVASASGWLPASAITAAVFLALALIDRALGHAGHASGHFALGPILTATAAHCFLDGWSVRALETIHLARITAPLGLAMHKVPEGLALGWVARRHLHSPLKASAAAVGVELITLVGALAEPRANTPGIAIFGSWWTTTVIAIVCGSFLFVGMHAVFPNRRRVSVLIVFAATLLIVATIGLVRSGNL